MTRESTKEEHEDVMRQMQDFLTPENPKVGIFWFDYKKEELFGVEKTEITPELLKKKFFTHPKLHRNYWQKWHFRAVAKQEKESIYYQEHNYTLIPRGRIFYNDGKYSVMVGDWIEKGVNGIPVNAEKLHDLICDEFDIPEDFDFVIDSHWNLGRGWSEKEDILDPHPRILKVGHAVPSREELETKALEIIKVRVSDITAKQLNEEQRHVMKMYLSLFPSEEVKAGLEKLWEKAERNLTDVNRAWVNDAHQELLDLIDGKERTIQSKKLGVK